MRVKAAQSYDELKFRNGVIVGFKKRPRRKGKPKPAIPVGKRVTRADTPQDVPEVPQDEPEVPKDVPEVPLDVLDVDVYTHTSHTEESEYSAHLEGWGENVDPDSDSDGAEDAAHTERPSRAGV